MLKYIARIMKCNCKSKCTCLQLSKPPTCVAEGIDPKVVATSLEWEDGTWREITQEEYDELQKPTLAERVKEAIGAIHTRLDTFAQTRDYKSILDAASYSNDTDPIFKVEGTYARSIRSLTWRTAYNIFKAVQSGQQPMSDTLDDFLAKLPVPKWPNQDNSLLPNV